MTDTEERCAECVLGIVAQLRAEAVPRHYSEAEGSGARVTYRGMADYAERLDAAFACYRRAVQARFEEVVAAWALEREEKKQLRDRTKLICDHLRDAAEMVDCGEPPTFADGRQRPDLGSEKPWKVDIHADGTFDVRDAKGKLVCAGGNSFDAFRILFLAGRALEAEAAKLNENSKILNLELKGKPEEDGAELAAGEDDGNA